MKKNWMQLLPLLVGVLLLVLLIRQSQTVTDLRRSLQSVENQIH